MGNALTWTMGRQLASFGDISYTYNEDGIRTSKTVDTVTTTYYLDGTNIIEQSDGTNTLHFYYDSNDEIIGFTYNEADYFYVKNAMSDIIGIVDNSGNLITSYAYDAWGKVLSVTGSNVELGNLNPFRYRSYYYDSDIEMYYLQSRYYDPEICRFINSDDVNFIGATGTVGSYNAFAYCENEPVGRVDDSGNASSKKKKSKYYITIYTYNEIGKWDLGHIDFSLDGKIYSYGTINNDADPKHDNTISNKFWGRVPGYVMVGSVKNWQNYLKNRSDSSKVVQDEVRINLTKSEYKKLKNYIKSFLGKTKLDFTSSKKIDYYEVKKGTYKKYSFTNANCSTFVRDALYACMPRYVKSEVYRISCNGYKSIYMPDNVFALAKLIGGIK